MDEPSSADPEPASFEVVSGPSLVSSDQDCLGPASIEFAFVAEPPAAPFAFVEVFVKKVAVAAPHLAVARLACEGSVRRLAVVVASQEGHHFWFSHAASCPDNLVPMH